MSLKASYQLRALLLASSQHPSPPDYYMDIHRYCSDFVWTQYLTSKFQVLLVISYGSLSSLLLHHQHWLLQSHWIITVVPTKELKISNISRPTKASVLATNHGMKHCIGQFKLVYYCKRLCDLEIFLSRQVSDLQNLTSCCPDYVS